MSPHPTPIASAPHQSACSPRKGVEGNREALVRFLEVWIRTQRFMSSPAPQDREKFASIISKASQIDFKVASAAIERLQAIGYWVNNNGLDKDQLMRQESQLVQIGTIARVDAPTYDKAVDTSLYEEAAKRLQAKAQ